MVILLAPYLFNSERCVVTDQKYYEYGLGLRKGDILGRSNVKTFCLFKILLFYFLKPSNVSDSPIEEYLGSKQVVFL